MINYDQLETDLAVLSRYAMLNLEPEEVSQRNLLELAIHRLKAVIESHRSLSAVNPRLLNGGYLNQYGVRVPHPCNEIDSKGRDLDKIGRLIRPADRWDDETLDRLNAIVEENDDERRSRQDVGPFSPRGQQGPTGTPWTTSPPTGDRGRGKTLGDSGNNVKDPDGKADCSPDTDGRSSADSGSTIDRSSEDDRSC